MSNVESPKNAKGIAKDQKAKRDISEMAPRVLEVVRKHPQGITAREITQELGFPTDEGQDHLPNLRQDWVVAGVLDQLAIKKPNQKREPPLQKKYLSEEPLYSLK